MKLIQEVSIWDNGSMKKASILDAYAINLILNKSATFYYAIYAKNENGLQGQVLAQGNISLIDQDYAKWLEDQYVWDFIAQKLGLVIIGNFVEAN
jgi:hypothetical protein